ncbi:MAG: 50S ribosomal protein L24 [Proteobacteria bacterium]|nr:50S ribosomal protein L24 [Pseudomonadota bacterium]
MQRIRKGDLVEVTAGADRGKQGRVMAVKPGGQRVRVEKMRMQKRHLKPGRKGARTGGIVEQEGYLHISNVMLVSHDGPSRTRIEVQAGSRVRVFAKGGTVPDPVES